MTIGLNDSELFSTFINSFQKSQTHFSIEKETADMGINPDTKELLARWQKQMPELGVESKAVIFAFILAIGDMIVANNEAISKVIPHE